MLSTKYTTDRLNVNKSVNKEIMVNRKMNFGWEIEEPSSFSSVCRRCVVNLVPIASLWNRSPVWILSTAISATTSIQRTIPSSLNMVMVSWWSPSFHPCSPSVYSPHRNQSDPVKTQARGATPLLKNPLVSENPVSLKIKAWVFIGYTVYDLPLTTLIGSHLPLTLCLLAVPNSRRCLRCPASELSSSLLPACHFSGELLCSPSRFLWVLTHLLSEASLSTLHTFCCPSLLFFSSWHSWLSNTLLILLIYLFMVYLSYWNVGKLHESRDFAHSQLPSV